MDDYLVTDSNKLVYNLFKIVIEWMGRVIAANPASKEATIKLVDELLQQPNGLIRYLLDNREVIFLKESKDDGNHSRCHSEKIREKMRLQNKYGTIMNMQ